MTHWISGIIAARPLLKQIAQQNSLNAPAELHQGLGFLPLDNENLAALVGAIHADRPDDADDGEAFDYLTPALTRWCAAQSTLGPMAYIETQYHGGVGGQGAILFNDGDVIWGPTLGGIGPINSVLSLLGGTESGKHDAFDTVGLSRHRMNDGWRKYPMLADYPEQLR